MNSAQVIATVLHLSPVLISVGVLLYIKFVLNSLSNKLKDNQRSNETITKDLKIQQHIRDYI